MWAACRRARQNRARCAGYAALRANGVNEIPDDWVRWLDWTKEECERFHVVDNETVGEWLTLPECKK